MKISIFTLHGANNVGAFLQAYSLQSVLQDRYGRESVQFVRFPAKAENAGKLQKVLGLLKQKKLGMMLFKYKSAKKYAAVRPKLCVGKDAFDEGNEYDAVVVGSDEVWNLDSDNFIHYPQYFGKNIKAQRIVSYAASANSTTAEKVREQGLDFDSFSAISVRDDNTARLVGTVSGKDPVMVCDPTVLPESFSHLEHPVPEKNYILVYSYGLTKEQVKGIKAYAKENGKKLISVGTYNAWCDKNIAVDPLEFLSWLNGADGVVTSTFHGTVLSVRHHKNFVVYSKKNHKIAHFLESVDLSWRNVGVGYDLNETMQKSIDYDAVEAKLGAIRARSLDFLYASLEESHD